MPRTFGKAKKKKVVRKKAGKRKKSFQTDERSKAEKLLTSKKYESKLIRPRSFGGGRFGSTGEAKLLPNVVAAPTQTERELTESQKQLADAKEKLNMLKINLDIAKTNEAIKQNSRPAAQAGFAQRTFTDDEFKDESTRPAPAPAARPRARTRGDNMAPGNVFFGPAARAAQEVLDRQAAAARLNNPQAMDVENQVIPPPPPADVPYADQRRPANLAQAEAEGFTMKRRTAAEELARTGVDKTNIVRGIRKLTEREEKLARMRAADAKDVYRAPSILPFMDVMKEDVKMPDEDAFYVNTAGAEQTAPNAESNDMDVSMAESKAESKTGSTIVFGRKNKPPLSTTSQFRVAEEKPRAKEPPRPALNPGRGPDVYARDDMVRGDAGVEEAKANPLPRLPSIPRPVPPRQGPGHRALLGPAKEVINAAWPSVPQDRAPQVLADNMNRTIGYTAPRMPLGVERVPDAPPVRRVAPVVMHQNEFDPNPVQGQLTQPRLQGLEFNMGAAKASKRRRDVDAEGEEDRVRVGKRSSETAGMAAEGLDRIMQSKRRITEMEDADMAENTA